MATRNLSGELFIRDKLSPTAVSHHCFQLYTHGASSKSAMAASCHALHIRLEI